MQREHIRDQNAIVEHGEAIFAIPTRVSCEDGEGNMGMRSYVVDEWAGEVVDTQLTNVFWF